MDTFTRLLDSLHVDSRCLGGRKRENCQLTHSQVFQLLLLMPFLAVKGFSHYSSSALSRMFGGKKDIFYSFMQRDDINWRNLVYRITSVLISRVGVREDFKKSHFPAVLIGDDSDFPKRAYS